MNNLKTRTRQANLISVLRQHGSLSVAELAALLDVSTETVRRDAAMLEQNGEVVKFHGAVSLPHNMGEATFERRMRENAPAKLAIARAAIQLVQDGASLIIDTGTTTTFFARELRQRRNLTVVTNSTEIARILADVPGNQVLLAGGEMVADSGAAYGPATTAFVSGFHVQHAFLSIGAISLDAGLSNATIREAEFGHAALKASQQHIILVDASKFDTEALARVCDLSDIHVLVTEQAPRPEYFAAMQQVGTKLLIAR